VSIKVMSWVWESGPAKQAERFVLLALADYCNDDGECWPAVSTIARKTCLSVRGVQTILRNLEAAGWLTTVIGGGRNNCNQYRISPAGYAPPQDMHPRSSCTTPPQIDVINPAAPADEPSRTINEPSRARARKAFNPSTQKRAEPSGYVYDKRLSWAENDALERAFIAQKVAAE
jgi:hypothetical protein